MEMSVELQTMKAIVISAKAQVEINEPGQTGSTLYLFEKVSLFL